MFRRITACLSLLSLVLVSLAPLSTFAAPANKQNNRQQGRGFKKLAPEFDAASNSTATVRVLIQTKGQPSATHDDALANAHGKKQATYAALNTLVAEVPANTVASLALRSDVDYISPDRPVKSEANLTNDTIGATQAQAGPGASGLSGKGVGIAILDSGISANHPDFAGTNGKSRVIASVDFTGSSRKGDADGHGTGVAGVAAGNGAASKGYEANYAGVAPGASLIDVRVLDENGLSDEFSILAAMQFVNYLNTNSEHLTLHGVNLSLSIRHKVKNFACGCTPVCEEAERLVSAGLIVVAAAGNDGYLESELGGGFSEGYRSISITDPGNAQGVITVGATHRDSPHTYGVSYFSSRGPTGDGRIKPDLVAPGEKITSTVPEIGLKAMDGTSMAAPHVSGAAALLIARYRELIGRPARVKQILCDTATDLGRERYFQGSGMVDILRAMQSV